MCPLRNIGTAIVFLVAVDAASLCAWTSDVTWTQDFGVNQVEQWSSGFCGVPKAPSLLM